MKKTALLGLVAAITLYSCGDSPRKVTIQPPSTILGSNYIPEAFEISLEAERNLPLGEMQNIMTTHFDTINKIEVGMRWKTKQVSIVTDDQGNICFRRVIGTKEVTSVDDKNINIMFDGTTEYLQGKDCWMGLNAQSNLNYQYVEANETVATINDVPWDSFEPNQFKIGFVNQVETIKNSMVDGNKSFMSIFPSNSPFMLYWMMERSVETQDNGQQVLNFAEVNQPL